MKIQISRLSPHQNAKVLAVLMAVGSLPFVALMFVAFYFLPAVDAQGNPVQGPPGFLILVFPLVYLVLGYVMVAIGCWLYNLLAKPLGGVEYEVRDS